MSARLIIHPRRSSEAHIHKVYTQVCLQENLLLEHASGSLPENTLERWLLSFAALHETSEIAQNTLSRSVDKRWVLSLPMNSRCRSSALSLPEKAPCGAH
jgi:hypothetical protein